MTSELHAELPVEAPDVSPPGTKVGLTEEDVRNIVRDEIKRAWAGNPASRRAALVASKGTLDWAYPPLILSTAAAAAGLQTSVFFTFYGLNIIHRDAERKLLVDPVGNPAMPMPVPMPDVLTGMPGMKALSTRMMKAKFAKNNVASVRTLLDEARELGVRLIGCQMTIDVFGYTHDDFVEGVEFGGAAAFMSEARKSHVTMFI
ncbi:DsrE/DsrF/DrsH-like family protein [Micromonospora sp. MS34]|uniref:DsrE/DsrF/DrsH-like family protein n=1 Tax=Micromonospora sp. MS34 TaxID=3385971 RepID=UPI0039A3A31F